MFLLQRLDVQIQEVVVMGFVGVVDDGTCKTRCGLEIGGLYSRYFDLEFT